MRTVYYSYPTTADLLVGCLDHAVDGADRRDLGPDADLAEQPWVRAETWNALVRRGTWSGLA